MSSKFIRCEFCKTEIPLKKCELATYHAVIDGKEYVFCCALCAKRYQQKKRGK